MGALGTALGTGLASAVVMLLLHEAPTHGWIWPFWLQATGLVFALSATAGGLFWFASARALKRQWSNERDLIGHEQRLNADLKRALDEHALVSISDVKGIILFANEKFCKVSGYSEQELLGQNHRIVNSGYHDADYFKAMWQTIERGDTWQGEFRNRRKNGSYYWVATTIIPFLDAHRKPYQYVAVRREITDLKEAQMCAQRLGERLQWLLDASPAIIYAHENPQQLQQCTFVSGNFSNVAGFTPQQFLGDENFWAEHLHPSDRQATKTLMKDLLATGEATVEYRFQSSNGVYRWISDHARAIRDGQGVLQAIVGSWSDVTDSKAMERERLRLLMAVEASADMIFLTDSDGVIEYANPAFCQFTGWKTDEVLGKPASILASGHTDPALYENMWSSLQQGLSWRGRLLNCRKVTDAQPPKEPLGSGRVPHCQDDLPDPLLYWAEVSITPIEDETRRNVGYVSFQRDISAKVAQEEREAFKRFDMDARLAVVEILNQSAPLAERFGRVLERLFDLPDLALRQKGGIFLRNRDTDMLDMFVLRGHFSEEFIRHEQCVPLGACLCGRAAASGELLISDDCFCDPRHEHRFKDMPSHGHYILPLVSGTETLGVLFLYTDPYPSHCPERIEIFKQIGEYMAFAVVRDQTQKIIELARDAALGASRQKSEFLANMSHEIRTPMNGVLGMLELLCRTPLSQEQKEYADTAARSAENLLSIINSILDFSRIEAGKLDLDYADFDLRELVEEVCALLATPAFAKGLELNCFIEPKMFHALRGDPTRLRQVMTNLIGNAIKFTQRGEVSVEVVCLSQDERRISLRFSVKDTGIGIAPEAQRRLFKPFEQGDSATTRRFGGTGLGLSISNSLVACMGGGEIHVESALDAGSIFWFALEFDKQHELRKSEPLKTLAHRKVLIVDDNATNRRILDRFLNEWGSDVYAAEDALQALQMLRAAHREGSPYELVILDMNMPGMDGLMLAKAMAREEGLAQIPRILLSSGGSISEAERIEAGILQALTKPVRQSILFDAVVSSLSESWMKPSLTVPILDNPLPQLIGRKVLLVEDNPINQRVALKMLQCFDLQVRLAKNGLEALDELEREPCELVFMDCHMPEMDGYAATQALREREIKQGKPRVPVIALTANALEGDREKCLQSGMDDHLVKPFMLGGLAEILIRWLSPDSVAPKAPEEQAKEPLWDREAALQRLGGDSELLAEMKLLFIDEAPKHLDILKTGQADLSAIVSAAHALKGMLLHFSAKQACNMAAQVEKRARAEDIAPVDPQIFQLISTVDALVEVFIDESKN